MMPKQAGYEDNKKDVESTKDAVDLWFQRQHELGEYWDHVTSNGIVE